MITSAKEIITVFLAVSFLMPIAVVTGQTCGCDACTQEILDRYSGFEPNRYKCGGRIEYLQDYYGQTELEACAKVAGQEFPYICGPECDPARCDATPSPAGITPYPTFNPDPFDPDLYCFPAEPNRVTYENVWNDFKVQVKERNSACGPGNNYFTRDTVSRSGNGFTLDFKYIGGIWRASEVRVVRTDEQPFTYGKYSFHVESVHVLDGANNVLSDVLPKDLVLGLFTWDPQDRYIEGGSENYMHEVDVEISRWGSSSRPDAQFLVQPPGSPQKFRFFTGPDGSVTYDQQSQTYSFEWLPTSIYWTTTAGGGVQTHLYTTEEAVKDGRRDYVQCLPAYVEVRLNLWSIGGNSMPDGLTDTSQFVRVYISDFAYEESEITHANPGDYCSKHCQCEGDCINGRCEDITTPPSPSPSCPESPLRFVWKEQPRRCRWVALRSSTRCQKLKMSSHCPDTCGSCDVYGEENSRATFLLGNIERTCAWLQGLKKWKKRKKCQKDSIAYTCRKTCAPFRT